MANIGLQHIATSVCDGVYYVEVAIRNTRYIYELTSEYGYRMFVKMLKYNQGHAINALKYWCVNKGKERVR
jgi:hypothetical protein